MSKLIGLFDNLLTPGGVQIVTNVDKLVAGAKWNNAFWNGIDRPRYQGNGGVDFLLGFQQKTCSYFGNPPESISFVEDTKSRSVTNKPKFISP